MFIEFDFSLGDLMISWESYLGSSVIVFIMRIKYMSLKSTAKISFCFLILVMVLCAHLVLLLCTMIVCLVIKYLMFERSILWSDFIRNART